jgi:hypothetical protein
LATVVCHSLVWKADTKDLTTVLDSQQKLRDLGTCLTLAKSLDGLP